MIFKKIMYIQYIIKNNLKYQKYNKLKYDYLE
jgi:hypothetical protein